MRSKIGLLALALWVMTLAGAVTLFVRGHTTTSPDGPVAVILSEAERDMVLGEMRGMLLAIANITTALAREDRPAIAAAAKAVGTAHAAEGDRAALMLKLPLEFKRSALAMHAGFDKIEAAARDVKSIAEITALVGEHLGLCIGCHAGYRFTVR